MEFSLSLSGPKHNCPLLPNITLASLYRSVLKKSETSVGMYPPPT